MVRRLIGLVAVAVVVLAGSTAWAQDPRVEISGTAGWTFSDGVNVGGLDGSPIRGGCDRSGDAQDGGKRKAEPE